MQVITAMNEKGGPGKSTIVAGLAAVLRESGATVAIADTDPQKSITEYLRAIPDDPLPVYEANDPDDIAQLSTVDKYDVMFIDTPGHLTFRSILQATAKVSDFVLVPMEPAPLSVTPTLETINELLSDNRYAVVLNRVDMRAPGRARQANDSLHEAGIPVCRTWIRQLSAHPDAVGERALITHSRANRATDAAHDMRSLALETYTYLGRPNE